VACGGVEDLCAEAGSCLAGACQPGAPKVCTPSSDCQEAFCDPTSGACFEQPLAEGASCGFFMTCQGGICTDLDFGFPSNSCTVNSDCRSNFCDGGHCGCRAEGDSCSGDSDTECCYPSTCQDGTCACGGIGAGCESGADCCTTICDVVGVCSCRFPSDDCTDARECCGVLPGCCAGVCVDMWSAPANCGACGVTPPSGGFCEAGRPGCSIGFHNDNGVCCLLGLSNCGGSCVDLSANLDHCGACGVECDVPEEICSLGHCCPVGYYWSGSMCCPVLSFESNGVCCAAGFRGTNGHCCPESGLTDWCGRCVDTDTDPSHCGTCDNSCPVSHPFCVSGVCCSIVGTCL
jgi:hypothetical protein